MLLRPLEAHTGEAPIRGRTARRLAPRVSGTLLLLLLIPTSALLLASAPARAGEWDSRAAAPSDPGALDAYDPLFDEEEAEIAEFGNDPFEGANRKTFAFNEGLDRWLLDPVTHGYQWLVPGPVRRSITRAFDNLNAPVIFANEVLQLRPNAAGQTLGRFVANTTLGLGGILDVAEDQMHIPAHEADFGQTLARYGLPRGPYLVIPLFGPATVRDALGRVVDQGLAPLNYLFGPLNLQWQLIRGSGEGLVLRDANLEALEALRGASVDYYAALRSAYLQSRRAMELDAAWGSGQADASVRDASESEADAGVPTDPALESGPAEDPSAAPGGKPAPPDQDSVPEASFSIRSSMAAISPSKFSRLTMPENSERRSASSLTVPSR
jgi:phospholipid-binding lipoprotein MlaA